MSDWSIDGYIMVLLHITTQTLLPSAHTPIRGGGHTQGKEFVRKAFTTEDISGKRRAPESSGNLAL